MTDERMGDALWPALARLPKGSGVVFRHYGIALPERRALFARVSRIAQRRRLILVRAGAERLGRMEAGIHGRHPGHCRGVRTWPAHDVAEMIAGRRAGADLFFVSPVFATRSHPGAPVLGTVRATALARSAGGRAIALGGMNERTARRLRSSGFYGWAAIDAWTKTA